MVNTGWGKSTKSVRADIGQGLIQDTILDKEYVYIIIYLSHLSINIEEIVCQLECAVLVHEM